MVTHPEKLRELGNLYLRFASESDPELYKTHKLLWNLWDSPRNGDVSVRLCYNSLSHKLEKGLSTVMRIDAKDRLGSLRTEEQILKGRLGFKTYDENDYTSEHGFGNNCELYVSSITNYNIPLEDLPQNLGHKFKELSRRWEAIDDCCDHLKNMKNRYSPQFEDLLNGLTLAGEKALAARPTELVRDITAYHNALIGYLGLPIEEKGIEEIGRLWLLWHDEKDLSKENQF